MKQLFLAILIVLAGCAAKTTTVIETKQEQKADVIVNNNRDWLGVAVVAGTLVAGYGLWEYYRWIHLSKSQDHTSGNLSPVASSTD